MSTEENKLNDEKYIFLETRVRANELDIATIKRDNHYNYSEISKLSKEFSEFRGKMFEKLDSLIASNTKDNINTQVFRAKYFWPLTALVSFAGLFVASIAGALGKAIVDILIK